MDGPVAHGAAADLPVIRRLVAWERSIYRRMEDFRPDLIIHMVADHAVSAARKPGEIDRVAYNARIAVMERLRVRDPSIVVIDAGESLEQVSAELFQAIWNKL